MVYKFDIKKAEVLESPDRVKYLNPDTVLDKIGLNREMVFADLGCGAGYFAIPAAMRVKKVYALDIQQEMLDILRDKIKKQKLNNIETILSGESSIPLPDRSVDVLFMANVFHELEDREPVLREAKRILARGGRMVIVDWKKVEMDLGPPVEARLAAEEVISTCERGSFRLIERSDAGHCNYFLIFEPQVGH